MYCSHEHRQRITGITFPYIKFELHMVAHNKEHKIQFI